MRQAAEWENRLFDRLIDLLDGFKEVRLNRLRSEDLFDDVVEVSRTAANIKIRTQSETFKRLMFSQSSMYVLLGAVVFTVPVFSDTAGGGSITKTTTALVFVVGACFGLVQSIPILTAANAAADNIEQLETSLLATTAAAQAGAVEPAKRFDRDRRAQHRIPLRRQMVRGDLSDRAAGLHLAVRRAGLHHRRQRIRQIDLPEGARGPLQARFGRGHVRRRAASTTGRGRAIAN